MSKTWEELSADKKLERIRYGLLFLIDSMLISGTIDRDEAVRILRSLHDRGKDLSPLKKRDLEFKDPEAPPKRAKAKVKRR